MTGDRNISQVEEHRESPLRHQTRKVSCSPDGRFFAVGSTEVVVVTSRRIDAIAVLRIALHQYLKSHSKFSSLSPV